MAIGSRIAKFSIDRHRLVTWVTVGAAALLALAAAAPSVFPRTFSFLHSLEVDTDPENMLSADEPVRIFHDRMKKVLALHDMVVVGVVNERGVFNPESLGKVHALGSFARTLAWRSEQDPARLEGVVEVDLLAPSTVDRITPKGGTIDFSYLMREPPADDAQARQILADARRIPLLNGTLVSEDGKAVALYLPLTRKSLSYRVYNELNTRIPVLWLWGPLAGEIRRMELPDGPAGARAALLTLGELAAFHSGDRDEFARVMRDLADRLAAKEAAGDWKAAGAAVGAWADDAGKIDAETAARIAAIEASLQDPMLEQSARDTLQAERKALRAAAAARAHPALVEHLRRKATESGASPMLSVALYKARSLRLADLPAAEQAETVAKFLEGVAADLAGSPEALRAAGLPNVVRATFQKHSAFPGPDEYHVTGLPVAEDTFGAEMFVQMAISAPAAMAVIFVLMLAFFRKLLLILAPMIVALVSVVFTMGALIVAGFPVHIMSSMIPIFIMPIAVLDSIHIISEFFEKYQATKDRRKTVQAVMDDLFRPMLYTSLTSAAGFASLALTPIPPVQVFGLFVAMGIMVAWALTVTFIPAFVMFIRPETLENFGVRHQETGAGPPATTWVGKFLRWVGGATYRRAKPILAASAVVLVVAGWGISRIHINDNPVKWFTASHPIRVADRVLNEHFGGTYMAYLAVTYEPGPFDATSCAAGLRRRAKAHADKARTAIDGIVAAAADVNAAGRDDFLDALERKGKPDPKKAGDERLAVWSVVKSFLDMQWYAEPPAAFEKAKYAAELARAAKAYNDKLAAAFEAMQGFVGDAARSNPPTAERFLAAVTKLTGEAPRSAAPGEAADRAWSAVAAFLGAEQQRDQVFKRPDVLAHLDGLQKAMLETGIVGKSNSLADIVKTVNRDLWATEASYGPVASDPLYVLPPNRSGVAQCLIQFQQSHRPKDLDHFVTPDYRTASMWVQLTSGDNRDMQTVVDKVDEYLARSAGKRRAAGLPELKHQWFGLTYINVIWQDKMVTGMLEAFTGSFLVVFLLMTILFRSALWGLLSMIPLTVTIAAIYGAVGIVGKDYDMPVAVLSSLTLGLAVDFAIHFLARGRAMYAEAGSWKQTAPAVFGEPARAITRNIIVIAAGFLPLLLAPLVPYKTVGALLATILLVSGVATLLLLPALIRVLEKLLFPTKPVLGLTCNCMTCFFTAAALAGLVVLNARQYLRLGWNWLAAIAVAIVGVMTLGCALSSRRLQCRAQASVREKDHEIA